MSVESFEKLGPQELNEAWPALSDEERLQGFRMLTAEEAEEFLSHLPAHDAVDLISELPEVQKRHWLRLLPPDDVVDIIQELPEEKQGDILRLLDANARRETSALLEYEEDEAGGLMTPRFARLRAEMTVTEAIEYLRRQRSENVELVYYAYVVDSDERLVGVVSFRELVISSPDAKVSELMTTDVVKIPDDMDQEEVSRIFAHEDLLCLPVVDEHGRMMGIVTADDVFDVAQEEATEDIHKMGGTEALDEPYLQVNLLDMLKKRSGWLVGLMLLGFLTVEAMGQFKSQLESGLAVLTLFIPLIISCGGNTGSQASTFIVRAMALGEVRPRDWGRVIRREIAMGLSLGAMLATTGMLAAMLWEAASGMWGEAGRFGDNVPAHVALAVALSILCIVLWGTIAGSMLPFLLRRVGADPASASAPLVATIVDATGLVIYFTVGGIVLHQLATP